MAFYQRLNPRLFVLSGVLALLFLVLLGGLGWQQLVKNSHYESEERQQTLRRILQPGPRGRILDRNGVPLVVNQPHYSVVLYVDEMRGEFSDEFNQLRNAELASTNDDTTEAHPTMDRNELYHQACINVAQRYLNQANQLLGTQETLDPDSFIAHVQQKPLLPYTLIADISAVNFARFNEEVPVASPMQTRVYARRYYPFGSLAFHTLGWVGLTDEYEDDDWEVEDLSKHSTFPYVGMTGLAGLEKTHNDTLTGKPGGEVWVVDPANSRVEEEEQKAPVPGQDFICSIDSRLQKFAEDRLEHKPGTIGSIAAIDVRTGEVLVLASKPDFDLNETVPRFSPELITNLNSTEGGWLNRATQGLYPPGSTFKIISSIAGLTSGNIDGNTILDCPAYLTIDGQKFWDDSRQDNGKLGIVDAIATSNDVFFYQMGLKMKWPLINQWAHQLGLGQQTGIGIPESIGLVPSPDVKKKHHPEDPAWRPSDDATFAFGQNDLLVTPLQMACVMASIARNEMRTYPTLEHNPNLPPETVTQHSTPLGLTPVERKLLLDGMEKAATPPLGTAQLVAIPGLRIAAKTGTAQWGPHKNTTIAWVVCFAPVDNPRIALAIAVESPKIGADIYGGSTDGPIVHDVLQEYFKLYPVNAN